VHLGDFDVNLGDQRARRVEHAQSPRIASARTAFDTPCALNTTVAPRGISASSSTKIRALALQVVDDESGVHDFVPNVNRCAVLRDRVLDDRDRPIDARRRIRADWRAEYPLSCVLAAPRRRWLLVPLAKALMISSAAPTVIALSAT